MGGNALTCKNEKRPKHLAYGQKYNKGVWCSLCDAHFKKVINKKAERQKSKREIMNIIKDEV